MSLQTYSTATSDRLSESPGGCFITRGKDIPELIGSNLACQIALDGGNDMKAITAPLSFLSANILVSAALAQGTTPDLETWHSWHAHSHGFWWIFPLLMLIFFFLCMRRGRHWWWGPPWRRNRHSDSWQRCNGGEDAHSQSALELLNRRFAQGEIDREEYEEKRSIISSS